MLVKMDTYFDGEFWCARGTDEDIFTQGATYDELLKNIKEVSKMNFKRASRSKFSLCPKWK